MKYLTEAQLRTLLEKAFDAGVPFDYRPSAADLERREKVINKLVKVDVDFTVEDQP